MAWARTPERLLSPVWPLPRSLALLRCFSSGGSPHIPIWFSIWCIKVTLCGFLHSEICGSKFAYNSPQLIAVNHVLHRLPMPRHSPCAHVRFTFRFFWNNVPIISADSHSAIHYAKFFTVSTCWNCWLLVVFTRLQISILTLRIFVWCRSIVIFITNT